MLNAHLVKPQPMFRGKALKLRYFFVGQRAAHAHGSFGRACALIRVDGRSLHNRLGNGALVGFLAPPGDGIGRPDAS
eukprot:4206076-Pleurochrysis_carterae.AAC.1